MIPIVSVSRILFFAVLAIPTVAQSRPEDLVRQQEARLLLPADNTEWFPSTELFRADPTGAIAIPVLIRILAHPNPANRRAACAEVAAFGPRARSATDALLIMSQESPKDHSEGAEAEARGCRHRAIWTLAAIGPPAPFLPALMERMRRFPPPERAEVLAALAPLDPEGKTCVTFLSDQLDENDRMLDSAVAGAIRRLGPKGKDAVPAIIKALSADSQNKDRGVLIAALEAIGPDAGPAREILTRRLAVDDRATMLASREALIAIGFPASADEVTHLAKAVVDGETTDAVIAAQRLGLAGVQARSPLPTLIAALAAPSQKLREAAAWAIGAIGPSAAESVPGLIRAIESEAQPVLEGRPEADLSVDRVYVVETLVEALARIGAASKPAIPLLRRLPPWFDAAETIRRIDPPKRPLTPIKIDPTIFAIPSFDPYSLFLSRGRSQPDGSFLVQIKQGHFMAEGGESFALFLSRDSLGAPIATADRPGPGRETLVVDSGVLTLKSLDWGSGKSIIGNMRVPSDPTSEGVTFQIPNPFPAPISRPK